MLNFSARCNFTKPGLVLEINQAKAWASVDVNLEAQSASCSTPKVQNKQITKAQLFNWEVRFAWKERLKLGTDSKRLVLLHTKMRCQELTTSTGEVVTLWPRVVRSWGSEVGLTVIDHLTGSASFIFATVHLMRFLERCTWCALIWFPANRYNLMHFQLDIVNEDNRFPVTCYW